MNKIFLAVIFLFLISSVYAACDRYTYITGRVLYENQSNFIGVEGANISVTCYHNNLTSLVNVQSYNLGNYDAVFCRYGNNSCSYGDDISIYASKENLYGQVQGYVQYNVAYNVNIGKYDIPMIPEFSAVIAGLTLVLAGIIFFLVRRN